MSLYKNWLVQAYNRDGESVTKMWDLYMPQEQKIYEDILENKTTVIKATVEELAKKYNMSCEFICGFLDGINDATNSKINFEELEETTEIEINIDFENLYKKMVEYKASHLYELEQWNKIFTDEDRRRMYKHQRISTTYIAPDKVGRNDPCPCGSGKKYKKCCGA